MAANYGIWIIQVCKMFVQPEKGFKKDLGFTLW